MNTFLYESDTRSDNFTPKYYMETINKMGVYSEFKYASNIGLSVSGDNGQCTVLTFIPWGDASGGYPKQLALTVQGVYYRWGTSNTTWGSWATL